MINQNQKLYYICEGCSKQETCKYYNDVAQTIENFIDTSLNIHFPMCSEYQSMLNKLWNDIENSEELIDNCSKILDISKSNRPEVKEFFQRQLKILANDNIIKWK